MSLATTVRSSRRALTGAAVATLMAGGLLGLATAPAHAATTLQQAAPAAATTTTSSWTASVTGVRNYLYNNWVPSGTATAPAGIPANATITGVSWTTATTINRTNPYGTISGTEIAMPCAPNAGVCSDPAYAASGSTADFNGMPATTAFNLYLQYFNPAHTNDGTRYDSIQYGFISVNPVSIKVTYSY